MSEETLNLIKTSFLSESAKAQLIDFFNNYGATDAFYQKFDTCFNPERNYIFLNSAPLR